MRARISQREARRLRRRVQELEERDRRNNNRWSSGYVGGVQIASAEEDDSTLAAINTARALRHAVVVTTDGKRVQFHALRVDA